MSQEAVSTVIRAMCPACQSGPGERCTQPTNTGRRHVNWQHAARIERAAAAINAYEEEQARREAEELRAALTAAGVASQEVIDDAADEQDDLRLHMLAPQPVIDEDALAEVIEAEIDKLRHETRLYPDIYKAEVARAVVEWLKGRGGESRGER